MNQEIKLHAMETRLIARILLGQIYAGYSAGGISFGRSRQASILEVYTGLIDFPKGYELNDFGPDDLVNELALRPDSTPTKPEELLCIEEIDTMTQCQLTLTALAILHLWYECVNEDNNIEKFASLSDKRRVAMVARKLPLPHLPVDAGTEKWFRALLARGSVLQSNEMFLSPQSLYEPT